MTNGTLDLTTSKNDVAAVFDVTAYPLFMRVLEAVPEAERTGPLVTDEDGRAALAAPLSRSLS